MFLVLTANHAADRSKQRGPEQRNCKNNISDIQTICVSYARTMVKSITATDSVKISYTNLAWAAATAGLEAGSVGGCGLWLDKRIGGGKPVIRDNAL